MIKKVLLISISTFIVVLFFYYAGASNKNNDIPQVKGIRTETVTSNNYKQDGINILLNEIAESYKLKKIEFYNTSFKWPENNKIYDLLGLGLTIKQDNLSLWPAKNILIQNNFILTDYPYGETDAYINNGIICVIKSNLGTDNTKDSIEIRCAYTNGRE